MIRYVSLAVVFAASFALPAASQPAGTKKFIQSNTRSYDQAFLESDGPAKLTKFFTSDGTIISPTASAVNGEREIAAFWNTVFKVEFARTLCKWWMLCPKGKMPRSPWAIGQRQ